MPTRPSLAHLSVLGLDLGQKRIGVAGCDRLGLLAVELATVERQSFEQDVATLAAIARDRQAQLLLIGMPYAPDGSLGKQAKAIHKLGWRLAQALGLPVVWVDERLSSVEAEAQLRSLGVQPSRDRGRVDRRAAAVIVQDWLDGQVSVAPGRLTTT